MSLLGRLRRWNRRRLARRHAPDVLASLAANETAILEALVTLVGRAGEERRARERAEDAAAERLAALEERLAASLGDVAARLAAFEERGADRRPHPLVEPTGRSLLLNPEADLLAHLAPALPGRTAIDVGANVGEISAALLDAGLHVHAFEPLPSAFGQLERRFAGRPGFRAYALAIAASDGVAQLHVAVDRSGGVYGDPSLYASLLEHAMPVGLEFGEALPVEVRSLESLHRAGVLPDDVALVKIDTEGVDLDVVRGMGTRTYPLVVAEYWDHQVAFARGGARNRLDELVAEMRRRGYGLHLVLYRVWGRGEVAWYANRSDSVERSWGNVLFFRERSLFSLARRWCAAELPRARFVPAPAAPASDDDVRRAARA